MDGRYYKKNHVKISKIIRGYGSEASCDMQQGDIQESLMYCFYKLKKAKRPSMNYNYLNSKLSKKIIWATSF